MTAESADGLVIDRRSTLALFGALGSAGLFSSAGSADTGAVDASADLDVSVDDDRPAGTEALLQLIADEYGDVLSEEQISQLESDVASNRESASTLRAFDLANGDDMATTFRAYRGSY
ncbi:hypothetical protein HSBGL_0065 [Halapricum desulfuricans]|uniref:Uncharacterized protein n=2 Tax=Halapricum desulfuricans TaxID=2841257 RepID=A0A897NDP9_9EURY|nr:hypothetical protein HSBGL_0065 [Halapricum desulfuricans]